MASGQCLFRRLLYDLEIWWMTSKNNKAPFLYYIKFCASFQSHRWIQTEAAVRKCSIRFKIGDFFVSCRGVTIRLATIRYISRYTTHDMVHDTIQNQLICYQWKILKHCGMCHQYCYIKTVILARNSEFKINKDVHNHPCPKYLLLTNCVCKQNNKIS